MDNSIIAGSLGAIARDTNKSIAESFVNVDTVIVVDTSGSMDSRDAPGGKTRIDAARDELRILQRDLPGKIAVLAFSTNVLFCPNGDPHFFGMGTDLARALEFAKMADAPGIRFIVISDGQPDNESAALAAARTFQNRIDVIYCGPEDYPRGRDFLERLAKASGGVTVTADRVRELASTVKGLLS